MKNLNEIRIEINEIDQKMKKLFIERMKKVKEIIEYKKQYNLDILDSSREDEVIKLNSLDLKDSEYYEYYLKFLKDLMKNSKEYQTNYLKK